MDLNDGHRQCKRHFQALLAAKEAEFERLRRALASAAPKARQRRPANDRQLSLVLTSTG
jgi:hypothetical protein